MNVSLRYTADCSVPLKGVANATIFVGDSSYLLLEQLNVVYYHCAAENRTLRDANITHLYVVIFFLSLSNRLY